MNDNFPRRRERGVQAAWIRDRHHVCLAADVCRVAQKSLVHHGVVRLERLEIEIGGVERQVQVQVRPRHRDARRAAARGRWLVGRIIAAITTAITSTGTGAEQLCEAPDWCVAHDAGARREATPTLVRDAHRALALRVQIDPLHRRAQSHSRASALYRSHQRIDDSAHPTLWVIERGTLPVHVEENVGHRGGGRLAAGNPESENASASSQARSHGSVTTKRGPSRKGANGPAISPSGRGS